MKKRNLIFIFVIFLFEIIVAAGTMAFLSWGTSDEQNTLVNFVIESDFMCSADVGGDITAENVQLAPAVCTNEKNAIKKKLVVYPSLFSDFSVGMDLWLEINALDSALGATDNFKYALTTNENSCTTNVVTSGNFNGRNVGDKINLLYHKVYSETISDGDEYWLYIWLDAAETSLATANKSFNFILNGMCTNEFSDYGYNYTITYDLNGGAGNIESQIKEHGVPLTLSDITPIREGYEFLGWSTNKDAIDATYAAGASYTTNAAATLYAVWEVSTMYLFNGGQSVNGSSLTGGWRVVTSSHGFHVNNGATWVLVNNGSVGTSLTASAAGWYDSNHYEAAAVSTVNKINLSSYSKLKVYISSSGYGTVQINVDSDQDLNGSDGRWQNALIPSSAPYTVEIDLSSLNSSYYVVIMVYAGSTNMNPTVSVTKVWLE